MLTLAPGSTCDVCLELFGQDDKAPCSIQCGHVFCVDCLNHISRLSCPLCRVPFPPHSVIKLHVDVDANRSTSPQSKPLSNADAEARMLQEAITSITNEGTTEARLRQLIAECKTFLSSQPRHTYSDFRASYRMLAYLCEVKSMLRTQEQSVEELNKEIKQMTTEKAELERAIGEMEASRKEDNEAALAVERSLRDHATRAHAAYQTMVECYNVVVSECFRLREDVQRFQYPKATVLPDSPPYSTGSPTGGSPTFASKLASGLDRKGLKDAAVADPNSLLISPLPQFTGGLLPTSEPMFATLPDVGEIPVVDAPTKPTKEQPEQEAEVFTDDGPCRAAGHPFTCHCVHFSVFSDEPSSSRTPSQASPASEQIRVAEETVDSHRSPSPASLHQNVEPPSVPPSASGSRSRSRSFKRSQSPSPSSSPPRKSKRSTDKASHSPSSDGGHSNASRGLSQSHDPEALRSRLHDILTTPISISLPNFPVDHFPTTFAREPKSLHREESSSKLPSRPPSRSANSPVHNTHRSSPKASAFHQNVECHALPSDVYPPVPSSTPIPPTRISSASAAAQALANAQRAERERQRVMDKDQRRQEKERHRAERDRLRSEARTPYQAPLAASAPTTLPTAHHNGNTTTTYSSTSGSTSLSRSGTLNRPGSTAPLPIYREGPPTSGQQHQRYGISKPMGHSMTASMATSASSTRLYA